MIVRLRRASRRSGMAHGLFRSAHPRAGATLQLRLCPGTSLPISRDGRSQRILKWPGNRNEYLKPDISRYQASPAATSSLAPPLSRPRDKNLFLFSHPAPLTPYSHFFIPPTYLFIYLFILVHFIYSSPHSLYPIPFFFYSFGSVSSFFFLIFLLTLVIDYDSSKVGVGFRIGMHELIYTREKSERRLKLCRLMDIGGCSSGYLIISRPSKRTYVSRSMPTCLTLANRRFRFQ